MTFLSATRPPCVIRDLAYRHLMPVIDSTYAYRLEIRRGFRRPGAGCEEIRLPRRRCGSPMIRTSVYPTTRSSFLHTYQVSI